MHNQQGLKRAEGLWFKDCGLIIQAESTLFRISRDFLALRFPIFRDVCAVPAPAAVEMMEGCPFVRLPDTAHDFDCFLRALVYSESFEPYPAKTTFPVLAGVLRMSHKYEVEPLRQRALTHFSSRYPTGKTVPSKPSEWSSKSSWSASSYHIEVSLLAK
ncbi:hypothetical protein DFH06DRAFT_595859 [Mycena polygramma]|nr:hypothetical protein DFH06DRAFT_595859 [Mycena polygramma]